MAGQFSKTDQRRITFLSLLSSATQDGASSTGAYDQALAWLDQMEADGFFEERSSHPTPASGTSGGPRRTSGRPASSSRPSNRGRDQARGNGQGGMRDPDGPPSDKQVAFLLRLTEDYTEDEVYDMTKKEVSELIEDLKD